MQQMQLRMFRMCQRQLPLRQMRQTRTSQLICTLLLYLVHDSMTERIDASYMQAPDDLTGLAVREEVHLSAVSF